MDQNNQPPCKLLGIIHDASFGAASSADARLSAEAFEQLAQSNQPKTSPPKLLFSPPISAPISAHSETPELAFNFSQRKLDLLDSLENLAEQGAQAVILPSWVDHIFLDELTHNGTLRANLPILNGLTALRLHIEQQNQAPKKIGILAHSLVRTHRLFERHFSAEYQFVYLDDALQAELHAIFSQRSTPRSREALQTLLQRAYQALVLQSEVEAILVNLPQSAHLHQSLKWFAEQPVPLFDSAQIDINYALKHAIKALKPIPKIGIVGGVGPAATIDLMHKIVRNSAATCDQEHLKILLEQNPQIPDRTAHLIGSGIDPTLAIYSTCKKLQAGGASFIVIPCNTAHAFVERIQERLTIPIVNMLSAVVEYIQQHYPNATTIGLLATSGTISSRVYHAKFEHANFSLIEPDAPHQAKVMRAIYGKKGVKAGYTSGVCAADLDQALQHLVLRGAEIVILGCTELPLLLAQNEHFQIAGRHIALLDPTEILARECVRLTRTEI